jgi:hypothetical protein
VTAHSQHNKKYAIINTNDCLPDSRRLTAPVGFQHFLLVRFYKARRSGGDSEKCDISHQIKAFEEKMIHSENYHLHNIEL